MTSTATLRERNRKRAILLLLGWKKSLAQSYSTHNYSAEYWEDAEHLPGYPGRIYPLNHAYKIASARMERLDDGRDRRVVPAS